MQQSKSDLHDDWDERRLDCIGQNGNTGEHYMPSGTTNTPEETIKERGAKYGLFINQAWLSQGLTDVMHSHTNWTTLSADQREALEMIQHKIARIINGNPDYADSWLDIAGYATLVERRLNGEII